MKTHYEPLQTYIHELNQSCTTFRDDEMNDTNIFKPVLHQIFQEIKSTSYKFSVIEYVYPLLFWTAHEFWYFRSFVNCVLSIAIEYEVVDDFVFLLNTPRLLTISDMMKIFVEHWKIDFVKRVLQQINREEPTLAVEKQLDMLKYAVNAPDTQKQINNLELFVCLYQAFEPNLQSDLHEIYHLLGSGCVEKTEGGKRYRSNYKKVIDGYKINCSFWRKFLWDIPQSSQWSKLYFITQLLKKQHEETQTMVQQNLGCLLNEQILKFSLIPLI